MDPDVKARRDKYLRTTYGISLAEFERVLDHQGGGCAGCSGKGKTRSLHVDHDHKSGTVRGILCAACNSALRKVKDNPNVARNLAAYLEKPPAVTVLRRHQGILKPPRRRRRVKPKKATTKR